MYPYWSEGKIWKKLWGREASFLSTCAKNPMTALVLECPGMLRTSWSGFNCVLLTAFYHPEILSALFLNRTKSLILLKRPRNKASSQGLQICQNWRSEEKMLSVCMLLENADMKLPGYPAKNKCNFNLLLRKAFWIIPTTVSNLSGLQNSYQNVN